jgi:hypothetical protein
VIAGFNRTVTIAVFKFFPNSLRPRIDLTGFLVA